MYITVTCPRCGRGIRTKKKFVLSQGGVPCLKCKVRISISKEQLDAYSETDEAADLPQSATTIPAGSVPSAAAESAQSRASSPQAPPAAPAGEPPRPRVVPETTTETVNAPAGTNPGGSLPPSQAQGVAASLFSSPTELALHHAFNGDGEADAIIAALFEPETTSQENGVPAPSGSHIAFTCPSCKSGFPLRRSLAGKKIRCKFCSRIVKVDPASPPIAGSDAPPGQTSRSIAPPPASPPAPEQAASLPETAIDDPATLRRELAEARDNAAAAEEILNQFSRDKIKSEMTFLRKTREAEAVSRDLAVKLERKDAEFKEFLAGKEAEVLALRTQAQELDVRARDLASRLESKEAETGAILSRKEAEAVDLLKKMEVYERQLQDLSQTAAAKTEEFNELKSRKEMETQILFQKVQGLEAQTRDLNASLKTKSEDMQALEARRDSEAGDLLKDMQVLESKVAELTAALDSKAEELQTFSAKKNAEAEGLVKKMHGFESQAQELTSQLKTKSEEWRIGSAKKDAEAEALLKQVLDLEAKVASLSEQLKAKDVEFREVTGRNNAEIKTLSSKVQEQETQAFDLAVALKAKEDRMEALLEKEGLLKALSEAIESNLKKEIDSHQLFLSNLRRQLKATG